MTVRHKSLQTNFHSICANEDASDVLAIPDAGRFHFSTPFALRLLVAVLLISYVYSSHQPASASPVQHQVTEYIRYHTNGDQGEPQPQQLGGQHETVQSQRQRPNILLLFPDQWRFDWDGRGPTYRHEESAQPTSVASSSQQSPHPPPPDLRLPNLDKLRNDGVTFTQAYVPAPICAPSRACLASGREYDECGVLNNVHNDYDVSIPTFYKLLRDGGYHTMTTGKDDLTKSSFMGTKPPSLGGNWTGWYHQAELGFSDGLRSAGKYGIINGGPVPYERYGHWLSNQTITLSDGTVINGWDAHHFCVKGSRKCTAESFPDVLYEDNWVTDNALTLLRRKPNDKPWFMQVSFPGPHPPFLITRNMSKALGERILPPPVDGDTHDGERCPPLQEHPIPTATDRCSYGAEIENLDRLFGLILSELDATGERDSTIVCVSSDHGEMLGDHGDIGKTLPWSGSVRVPLVCSGPGIVKNKVISNPVGTMDLAATFLDIAGVDRDRNMASVSLRSFLMEKDAVPAQENYRAVVLSGLQASGVEDELVKAMGWDAEAVSGELAGPFSWRMVVEVDTGYKFVCCQGPRCPGQPSNVPVPPTPLLETHKNGDKMRSEGVPSGLYTELLYNATFDPFDMHPLLSQEYAHVKDRLRARLPVTPHFDCSAKMDISDDLVRAVKKSTNIM